MAVVAENIDLDPGKSETHIFGREFGVSMSICLCIMAVVMIYNLLSDITSLFGEF